MNIKNPAFHFCFNIENLYTLLWMPNVYRSMVMRISTPCLFFQCVFNDF